MGRDGDPVVEVASKLRFKVSVNGVGVHRQSSGKKRERQGPPTNSGA